MAKVTRDVAIAEVHKWLESKKISERVREDNKDAIERIADSIEDGYLTLDDSNKFILTLKFEIGEEEKITQLTFRNRVDTGTIELAMQGVKVDNLDGRLSGYVAAITGRPRNIIKKLDPVDAATAKNIAIFFM